MARVGVLLSGCGYQDGSEVYEAVLTLLALEKAGAQVQAMAPDINQAEVVDHYRGEEDRTETNIEMRGHSRNVLAESARIVRGKIIAASEVSAHQLDALIIIGGWGAVKNLCSFYSDGAKAKVNPAVGRLIRETHGLGKPIGAMCAGPILVAVALNNENLDHPLSLTIGNDAETMAQLKTMGVEAVAAAVDEIHTDPANHLITTPAFMLAKTAGQAEAGINALVNRVMEMTREISHEMPAGGKGNTVPGLTPDLQL